MEQHDHYTTTKEGVTQMTIAIHLISFLIGLGIGYFIYKVME